MLFSSILVVFFLSQSLFAVDLNIYKSVTEVRGSQKGVGIFEYSFKTGEYEDIVDGSITWDGTPFVRQEIYNTIDTLKCALVTVRQSTACECKVIEAKIVDPATFLLENLATGAYFYADSRTVEYTSKKPSNGGTVLTIEFNKKKNKYKGTLSYLMRGISWSPYYDLFVADEDTCNLQGYAVIRNNQQQEYEIKNTHLYSGDLQLANSYSGPLFFGQSATVAQNAKVPSVEFVGEQKGFYSYSLDAQYTLRPSSSIRLPFITAHPKCRFYYQTSARISAGQYSGVFQRTYDLTPDQFLPGGILTVRDNQVLIGQSNLPDVPDNYTQKITLGEDNDVRYTINGNQTASSENDSKITWRTYALDITISNFKNKDVKGQLDFYGGIQTSIEKGSCNLARVSSNTINFPFDIKATGNYRCQLKVTLTWG